MSDISDPGNILLCRSWARIAWCDWEQNDLSESPKAKYVRVNTNAHYHLLPVPHYVIPIIIALLKHY